MTSLTDKLVAAQKHAMSVRPLVGGFPVLAEVLRQAGVTMNRWNLPSCQSVYLMEGGAVVQQSPALILGTHEVPGFDEAALIAAIRADQVGKTTFQEFLQASWAAGVVAYDADFVNRKVTYYGVKGEAYVEDYPAAEL